MRLAFTQQPFHHEFMLWWLLNISWLPPEFPEFPFFLPFSWTSPVRSALPHYSLHVFHKSLSLNSENKLCFRALGIIRKTKSVLFIFSLGWLLYWHLGRTNSHLLVSENRLWRVRRWLSVVGSLWTPVFSSSLPACFFLTFFPLPTTFLFLLFPGFFAFSASHLPALDSQNTFGPHWLCLAQDVSQRSMRSHMSLSALMSSGGSLPVVAQGR